MSELAQQCGFRRPLVISRRLWPVEFKSTNFCVKSHIRCATPLADLSKPAYQGELGVPRHDHYGLSGIWVSRASFSGVYLQSQAFRSLYPVSADLLIS
jgi:hypothetical protein